VDAARDGMLPYKTSHKKRSMDELASTQIYYRLLSSELPSFNSLSFSDAQEIIWS
jgi:hypothetical protein